MPRETYRQTVLRIATEVCQGLFRDYGVPLRPLEDDQTTPGPALLCGVIGFSGKGLRGNAIIGSSTEVLLASNPSHLAEDRHWAGELANQFVGRIQNALTRYGVEIFISTPVTLRGDQILPVEDAGVPRLVLESEKGRVWVWLELCFAKTFQMLDQPDPALGGAVEGQTLLF